MFPPEQKSEARPLTMTHPSVRTFVAILLSGTPAAANQLVVTQLYNPEGTADTLASFLLLQCKFGSFTFPLITTDLCMFVLST